MLSLKTAVAAAGLALATGPALAYEDIKFYLNTIPSWDGLGDPDNFDAAFDLNVLLGRAPGSPVSVIGIGWAVELRTVEPSFLSEARLKFDDNDAPGSPTSFFLIPGAGDTFSGAESYNSGGVIDLASVGLPDLVLSQGNIAFEFFESFDDAADQIDAYWNGSLVVRVAGDGQIVPLPGGAAMGLAGLGIAASIRRRRA